MIRSIAQNRLRSLLKEHQQTLEQVSQAAGLAFSTLQSAETQEREIALGNAFMLAKFYGLPPEIIWQRLCNRICHKGAPAPKPKLS